MFKITRKQYLNDSMVLMDIEAPLIAKKAKAGQFIILRIDEKGERIPLTMADWDAENGTVTIIFQKVGATTKLLGALNAGDSIADFVGPLGQPTEIEGYRSAIVIGGGAGCAIAYPQAKALHAQGASVEMIAGFRNKDIIFFEDEMKKSCDELTVTTDDGSNGNKGFVTDALKAKLDSGKHYDLVVAIGPLVMMRAVANLTREYNIKTIVSLNPIMIDGTGMCGGCRVTVGGKTKFACVDGPDFDGHEVDFDILMRRASTYREQEQHACKLYGGDR